MFRPKVAGCLCVCVCVRAREHANEEGGEPAPRWVGLGGWGWGRGYKYTLCRFSWHGLRRPAGDVIHLVHFGVGAKCVSGPWS